MAGVLPRDFSLTSTPKASRFCTVSKSPLTIALQKGDNALAFTRCIDWMRSRFFSFFDEFANELPTVSTRTIIKNAFFIVLLFSGLQLKDDDFYGLFHFKSPLTYL